MIWTDPMKTLRIMGVDPGMGHTGWAVIEGRGNDWKIIDIYTFRNRSAMHDQEIDRSLIRDCVVSVAHNYKIILAATQVLTGNGKFAFFTKGAAAKVRNAELSQTIHGALCVTGQRLGFGVIPIPSQDCKGKGFKMDKTMWQRYWDYDGNTSEDARDATQIARMGADILAREK